MAQTIHKGTNKRFLCKIGIHKWTRWRMISSFGSHVDDLERRCIKCGMIKRKTVPA